MSLVQLLSPALDAEQDDSQDSQVAELSAPCSPGRESSRAPDTGSTSTSASPGPKPLDSCTQEQRVWLSGGIPRQLQPNPVFAGVRSSWETGTQTPHIYRTASKKFSRRSCQGLFSSSLLRSCFFRKGGENQTLKVTAVARPVPDAGDGSGTSAHGSGTSPSAPCAFC